MTDIGKQNILSKIKYPEDLRKLPVEKLPQVCDELRADILKELSVNPGHLASSLGALELTVALHYVFNTPYDRIVWDVDTRLTDTKSLQADVTTSVLTENCMAYVPSLHPKRANMTVSHAVMRPTPSPQHLAWPWQQSRQDMTTGMWWL